MSKSTITVLVFEPGKEPLSKEIPATHAAISAAVGCVSARSIGLARHQSGSSLELFFDDDFMAKSLAPNILGCGPTYAGAPICGTAVLVRATDWSNGIYTSLVPDDVAVFGLLPKVRLEGEEFDLADELAAERFVAAMTMAYPPVRVGTDAVADPA